MDKGSLLLTIVSFPFNVCDIDLNSITFSLWHYFFYNYHKT